MRTTCLAIFSSIALSISATAIADPANTSAAAAAAPEPMAQSSTLPAPEHTDLQAASVTTQAGGEKLICHHRVHEGQVLPQQICLTQRDWERVRLNEQKHVSDWQLHGYQAGVK
jgi:SH3-like domain-containing protein